ncbi:unnamed protein product [Symbiodinium natans]|uniref:Uncharacterized protein n=1 Tax=Symbiodinium natans TaxID=878477 RepID=A0A812IIY8_9DINO|nr:unnamed protein product [Symbiodinium natans]
MEACKTPTSSAACDDTEKCSQSSSDSFAKVESGKLEFAFGDPRNCGITLHYFTQGFVVGGIDSILVNVLAGYLNVPSNIQQGAVNMANLPCAFAVLLGILSDARPIFGYRRRPYMAGGWLLSAACFAYMVWLGLPAPYYCFAEGQYLRNQTPCNPDAADFYVWPIVCLCLSQLGMTAATASAQGLLVEYAKAEPEKTRGRTQALLQMVGTAGSFCAVVLVAFGFNGQMFTGSFSQRHQLSYPEFLAIFAVLQCIAGLSCIFCVREHSGARASVREYARSSFHLLENKAFSAVALYFFANSSLFNIATSAGLWVSLEWAKVENMQRQLSSLFGMLLTLLGCWLTQRCLLGVSWRKILFGACIFTNVLDMFPQFMTIFDIVRDQYFYLGEPLTRNVPIAMSNLVTQFLVNELADEKNCALVVGLLTTIGAVGQPLSVLLSNQLFSLFTPDLFLRENYVKDTPAFRWTVASSFLLSYSVSFLGMAMLPLLPSQKLGPRKLSL